MITFFVGLAVVLVLGGAVTRNIQNNPTTATQWRQAVRAAKTKAKGKGKPYDGPSRAWIAAKATGQVLRTAGGRTVNLVRGRKERRLAKVKAAHDAAKERGDTAATRAGEVVVERRGWRGALEDLREAVRPRPAAEETGPPAEPGTPPEAAEPPAPAERLRPSADAQAWDRFEAERAQGTGSLEAAYKAIRDTQQTSTPTETPDASAAPANVKEAIHMPTYTQLFEMTDTLSRQPFEHIEQVHQFIKALRTGTGTASNMYRELASRMVDKMHIDPIVTEHVGQCARHQLLIEDLVGTADVDLEVLLSATTNQLLERGGQLPARELLEGAPGFSGSMLVPQFFETASGLAGRPFVDLRDVHCLLKALQEASSGQEGLYTRVARELEEQRIYAEHFRRAARVQHAITASLADADTNMARLLNMTIRELAASNIKAPDARLLNA